jgi:hypothetical protein
MNPVVVAYCLYLAGSVCFVAGTVIALLNHLGRI